MFATVTGNRHDKQKSQRFTACASPMILLAYAFLAACMEESVAPAASADWLSGVPDTDRKRVHVVLHSDWEAFFRAYLPLPID